MNLAQRIVALIGGFLLAAILLYPPWKYVQSVRHRSGTERIERDAGHASVFSPPSVKDHKKIRRAYSIPETVLRDPPSTATNATTNATTNLAGGASQTGRAPAASPTPVSVPVEIDEAEFEVFLDSTRLPIQCGVVFFAALGLIGFLHKRESK